MNIRELINRLEKISKKYNGDEFLEVTFVSRDGRKENHWTAPIKSVRYEPEHGGDGVMLGI